MHGWMVNISRCVNNEYRIIEYNPPKGTRVSNVRFLVARNHHISFERGPNRGFSLSRFARIPRTNEIAASFHGTLSLPFLPLFFFLLFLFFPLFFKEKPPLRGVRRARRKEGGGGGGRRKQYAVGQSRGGVQTPASPISRLVVKHRALGRFRGAARLCRCFRPRPRGFYTARIYIYIYIYTQKRMKKRITSPLSKYAANRLEEREIGS